MAGGAGGCGADAAGGEGVVWCAGWVTAFLYTDAVRDGAAAETYPVVPATHAATAQCPRHPSPGALPGKLQLGEQLSEMQSSYSIERWRNHMSN
jgi:hypothetical protein